MLTHIKDNRNSWTVIVNNKQYQFDASHPDYIVLADAVNCGNDLLFTEVFDRGVVIQNWSDGLFSFEDGVLYYVDEEIHQTITGRIVDMIKNGFSYHPMLRFLERLYKNTSYRAINELYTFLEHKHLPITPDGYFLAYKSVAVYYGDDIVDKMGRPVVEGDYVDKYTEKSYRNNVGDENVVPRFKVDDDCSNPCSNGLHVGAIDYVNTYFSAGDAQVLVQVDPADVVSVPLDADHMKVRTSRYKVIGIFKEPLDQPVYSVVEDEDEDYEDDDYSEAYKDEWEDDDDDYPDCDQWFK